MATALLPVTELDFAQVKSQLKTYLQGQTRFKDYDFDGSNLSVLLDVLAYNTYQNNFYANMTFSEMFLDSAQRRSSVVSHAKELGYLPRSAKSSSAVVDVTIVSETQPGATILIPAGARFNSVSTSAGYSFYTAESHLASRVPATNRFEATCIEIFEGALASEVFYAKANGSYQLLNSDVDSSSVRVFVGDDDPVEYKLSADIFGLSSDSEIFFLEPAEDGYSVVFGRNTFGKEPAVGSKITIESRVASGSGPNGSNKFTTQLAPNATVTVRSPARSGAPKESLSNIKFFAPRAAQVQERAVTRRDYEVLLKQRFPEILDVSVYDGADLSPPQHGKVAVSVNIDGGISGAQKAAFLSFLADKTPLAIQPIFIEADFMYLTVESIVFIDGKTRTLADADFKQLVRDTLRDYNSENLEKFGSSFRESRVTQLIDASDRAILSNTISVRPYVEYVPLIGVKASPSWNFGAKLAKPYAFSEASGFANYKPAVRGGTFYYRGTRSFFQDDGTGKMQIISADAKNTEIIIRDIGVVDYDSGVISLADFVVDSFEGSAIRVSALIEDEDVTAPRNRVLEIRPEDISVILRERN